MNPEDLLAAYSDAIFHKDIEAILALYVDDLRQFDTWDQWEVDKPQLKRNFESWFEWMGDDVNRPRFKDIRVIEEKNLAVLQAYVTFQRINPRGELVESMKNRTTLVLIRERDAWKIWHDHTSIPVEMVSFKGMLAKE